MCLSFAIKSPRLVGCAHAAVLSPPGPPGASRPGHLQRLTARPPRASSCCCPGPTRAADQDHQGPAAGRRTPPRPRRPAFSSMPSEPRGRRVDGTPPPCCSAWRSGARSTVYGHLDKAAAGRRSSDNGKLRPAT